MPVGSCGEEPECFGRNRVFVQSCSQFAAGDPSGVRRSHDLPEQRVVGVTTQVESQVLFQLIDDGEATVGAGLLPASTAASAGHVGGVRLMQLHNLGTDMWFQGRVVVVQAVCR